MKLEKVYEYLDISIISMKRTDLVVQNLNPIHSQVKVEVEGTQFGKLKIYIHLHNGHVLF